MVCKELLEPVALRGWEEGFVEMNVLFTTSKLKKK